MQARRAVIALTVTLIVGVSVLSGPLVPGVDFTTAAEGSSDPLSAGTTDRAVVDIVERPAGPIVLDRGAFGNDPYFLEVPSITVVVQSVQGTPRLAYEVRIPALGYSRVTAYFLNASMADRRLTVTVTRSPIDSDRLDGNRTEYDGELILRVFQTAGETVVFRTNATVVVRR